MSRKNKGNDEAKAINLMRFAYDIFRYSALKFKVQSQTIAEWAGPQNDYGCSDFIPVVSRLVLKHQINLRIQINYFFKSHFEPHMRNSLEHISEITRKVIASITMDHSLDIITHVEYSLASLCELILFLYSENSNFFLVKLTELWFQCYLKPNKTKFVRKGALYQLYKRGKEMQRDLPDAFIDIFISAHATNYRKSLKDGIFEKYHESVTVYNQKHYTKFLEPSADPPIDINLPRYIYTFVQDEKPGVDLPPNPLLGIAPPNEMYDFSLAGDAPLSPNMPEEHVQDHSKRSKRQSYKERRQGRRPRSRSSTEQGHGQLSPDPSKATVSTQSFKSQGAGPEDPTVSTQSYKSQGAGPEDPTVSTQSCKSQGAGPKDPTVSTQSYKSQGARPKDPAPKHPGLQIGESGLCSSGTERLERLSLDSSKTKESRSVQVLNQYLTPSERSLEAQLLAQYSRGLLELPKIIGPSEEEGIQQLSPDSSVLKQSIEEMPDILEDDDGIFLGNPEEPTKEQSESTSEEDTEGRDI